MMKKDVKGFTLIELLVVISIISLLLAVVLPVLGRAKENARSIVCKSLVKNYSLALYAYFVEQGDLLPISVNDPVMRPWHTFDEFRTQIDLDALDETYKQRQTGQLQEYLPSYPKKYICPSARYAINNSQNSLYAIDRSYGLNAHVYYFKDYIKRRLESQSSRVLSMGDALDWWFNYWQCDKFDTYGDEWVGINTYGSAAFRHNENANMGFWDGHVDQMTSPELKEHLEMWLHIGR